MTKKQYEVTVYLSVTVAVSAETKLEAQTNVTEDIRDKLVPLGSVLMQRAKITEDK